MSDVYVTGVGMTRFGKRDEALQELMAEASRDAIKSSGYEDVEAIYVGVMSPTSFLHEGNFASLFVDHLGMSGVPSIRVETASSTGAAAFQEAFNAVASGYYSRVLVVAGEKMSHLSTRKTTSILSEVIERKEREYGATMPALAAMITLRYAHERHLSISAMEKVLARVAIKNHTNGLKNPYAHLRKEIDEKTYRESSYISYPLRLFDCAPISDGAVALILSNERSDVRIAGMGHGTDAYAIRHRETLTSFRSTVIAAQRAFRMAGMTPKDIDFAEIHDAFTSFELVGLEDMGFYEGGEVAKKVLQGCTDRDGELPVNPSGGLKSRGHPVGASGLAQIAEVVWQLQGRVEGERQLPSASVGLAQSIGGLATNNFVTILERSDHERASAAVAEAFPPEHRVAPPAQDDNYDVGQEGTIETYTILHYTPEGIEPPLILALLRDRNGNLLMSRGLSESDLKIGKHVYIKRLGGLYYFSAKSFWKKVRVLSRRNIKRYNRRVRGLVQSLHKKAS